MPYLYDLLITIAALAISAGFLPYLTIFRSTTVYPTITLLQQKCLPTGAKKHSSEFTLVYRLDWRYDGP